MFDGLAIKTVRPDGHHDPHGQPESSRPAETRQASGELVRAARERLLALPVGVGPTVVHQLMGGEG